MGKIVMKENFGEIESICSDSSVQCLYPRKDNTSIESTLDRHYVYAFIKRSLDFILSGTLLIILAIPFLVIAMIIKCDSNGKIIFKQNRIGLKGKEFQILKFRTMHQETPQYIPTSEFEDEDENVTRFGRILRNYSIDELPQLINVFKGDMSLIGPRPLIKNEGGTIHKERLAAGVYNIRPGITGLAQINGRDNVTQDEKLKFDIEYCRNFGIKQDLKIILTTIPKVIHSEDVKTNNQA